MVSESHDVVYSMKTIERNDPYSFLELYKAAFQCRKSVSWKESVTIWLDAMFQNVSDLVDELDSETYRLEKPTIFHIIDPKPRTISATKFPDRVVQRSICDNGTYQDLTNSLIYDNCACQKGKGTKFTFDRVKHHLRRYYIENGTNDGYCIRIDIRKYFPSIPHKLLKEVVRKHVNDEKILKMLEYIIDDFVNVVFDDDMSFCQEGFGIRGIGLGSQLSQLFALLFLSELDHYIKEKLHIRYYMRYMDDILIVVRTESEAKMIFDEIRKETQKIGLTLNDKSCIFRLCERPIEFLKVEFTLTKTGGVKHRVVRKTLNREIVRLNKMVKDFRNNKISYSRLLQHLNTWSGFAKLRCSKNQMKNIRRILKRLFEGFEKITPIVVESEDEIILK